MHAFTYPYIRAWSRMMGIPDTTTLARAREADAPADAVFLTANGHWYRYAELRPSPTRDLLDHIVQHMAHGC